MAEWMKLAVLAVLFVRAVYTDIKRGKVENWLIATGLAAGLLFACIRGGPKEILYSIKMAGVILLALFFLFVIKGLGAGDIKLLCVTAIFFPERAVSVVIVSFFVGAAVAIGKMLIRWMKKELFLIKNETVNFSMAIVIGTVIVYFWG